MILRTFDFLPINGNFVNVHLEHLTNVEQFYVEHPEKKSVQRYGGGVSQVFGVSHRFREGATCTSAVRSLVRGALSKPMAHSASLSLYRVVRIELRTKFYNGFSSRRCHFRIVMVFACALMIFPKKRSQKLPKPQIIAPKIARIIQTIVRREDCRNIFSQRTDWRA